MQEIEDMADAEEDEYEVMTEHKDQNIDTLDVKKTLQAKTRGVPVTTESVKPSRKPQSQTLESVGPLSEDVSRNTRSTAKVSSGSSKTAQAALSKATCSKGTKAASAGDKIAPVLVSESTKDFQQKPIQDEKEDDNANQVWGSPKRLTDSEIESGMDTTDEGDDEHDEFNLEDGKNNVAIAEVTVEQKIVENKKREVIPLTRSPRLYPNPPTNSPKRQQEVTFEEISSIVEEVDVGSTSRRSSPRKRFPKTSMEKTSMDTEVATDSSREKSKKTAATDVVKSQEMVQVRKSGSSPTRASDRLVAAEKIFGVAITPIATSVLPKPGVPSPPKPTSQGMSSSPRKSTAKVPPSSLPELTSPAKFSSPTKFSSPLKASSTPKSSPSTQPFASSKANPTAQPVEERGKSMSEGEDKAVFEFLRIEAFMSGSEDEIHMQTKGMLLFV